MPRTRMMGAGLAGSSAYRSRTHGDQGGGNKLQGLPPTTKQKTYSTYYVIYKTRHMVKVETLFFV